MAGAENEGSRNRLAGRWSEGVGGAEGIGEGL